MDLHELESKKFKTMINFYLSSLNIENIPELSVLDIACGKCWEAEVLLELFSNNVYGIDNDPKNISELNNRLVGTKSRFEVADATDISQLMDEQVDLVIARHPPPDTKNWRPIFQEAYNITKPNGLIISTFYSNLDYKTISPLIKEVGYKIKRSEENPFGYKISTNKTIQAGFDRFITIGKKEYQKENMLISFAKKYLLR